MTRTLLFILILSFFGFGKSNAQKNKKNSKKTEQNKGVIATYVEDDFTVIMKFENELPDQKIMSKLPFLTVVSWKYNGTKNNGMPLEDVNKRMIVLEDALENSMHSTDLFMHVYSRTGNSLKEFAYYSSGQKDFMGILNQTLKKHKPYPIEINFYEDEEWSDFKKILEMMDSK